MKFNIDDKHFNSTNFNSTHINSKQFDSKQLDAEQYDANCINVNCIDNNSVDNNPVDKILDVKNLSNINESEIQQNIKDDLLFYKFTKNSTIKIKIMHSKQFYKDCSFMLPSRNKINKMISKL